jgi:hypothetical protein
MRRNNPDKVKVSSGMACHTGTTQGLYSLSGDGMLPETTPAVAGWRYAQYDGIVALAAVSLSGQAGGLFR